MSCGCGASTRSRSSAWPCSSSSGRTTNTGCWRGTTTEAPLRYDATSSGWTRQRRSEYRQTTVQEPWGDTVTSAAPRSLSLRIASTMLGPRLHHRSRGRSSATPVNISGVPSFEPVRCGYGFGVPVALFAAVACDDSIEWQADGWGGERCFTSVAVKKDGECERNLVGN